MLAEIKTVKMMGLSGVFTSLVQNQRDVETNLMAAFRSNVVWMNVFSNLPAVWAPLLTFAAYSIQSYTQGTDSIGTTQAFTSLAIIGLVTKPAAILLSSIVSIAASVGCFDRIQKFLVSPPRKDQRNRSLGGTDSSDALEATSEDLQLHPLGPSASSDSLLHVAISVDNADIRPSLSADPVLRGVTLRFPGSLISMITGPVASGKTTLLRALIGEVPYLRGSINMSS